MQWKYKFEGNYFLNKIWNGKGYDNIDHLIYKFENGKGKVEEYNKVQYLDGKSAKGE